METTCPIRENRTESEAVQDKRHHTVNESIGIIPSGGNGKGTARVRVQQKKSSMNSKESEYVSSRRNTYSGSKKCPNVCMFFTKVDNP